MGTTRTVIGKIALSLDGRINGVGGAYDMSWIVPHAVSDVSRRRLADLHASATTAVLGRTNFQGFGAYWPGVVADDAAHPADRAFSSWFNEAEKVVFSTTLSADEVAGYWAGASLAEKAPAAEIKRLRGQPGGDILVLSSASVIRALVAAEEIDNLSVLLCPELVGGGERLFTDEVPASSWVAEGEPLVSASGAVELMYAHVAG